MPDSVSIGVGGGGGTYEDPEEVDQEREAPERKRFDDGKYVHPVWVY